MMRFRVVQLTSLPAAGMAIFPFILVKHSYLARNKQLMNHELIHIRQQAELLVLPFYLLYILNYLINLLYYHSHSKAYQNIVFEREAFKNDANPNYLKGRRFAAWLNYL